MLTRKRLKEVLYYDPLTGVFTWFSHAWCTGKTAGSKDTYGHIQICVDGQRYLAHRLAWFYMRGRWPKLGLDHADLNRSNNAWCNLRLATFSQNNANRRSKRGALKGIKYTKNNRWRVVIGKNKKTGHSSNHLTLEEAKKAYERAAKRIFGPFFRND